MHRTSILLATILLLFAVMAQQPAAAQYRTVSGAVLGGFAGAVIGGTLGGSRGAGIGAAIGTAAGAFIGATRDARLGGYFWDRGRCHYRYPNGSVIRVARDYCY